MTLPSKDVHRNICQRWIQPPLHGGGYVHLDATYWGHNWGILLAQDSLTGFPLYLAFINSETTADYKDAISNIEDRGYQIKGIIIDGKKSLFKEFVGYKIQMCQFHMKEIIKRNLTKNPRLKAARALLELMDTLTYADEQDFMHGYEEWKSLWHDTLYRRTQHKDGTTPFIHRKLRTAMHSLDFYLPYLFTYQLPECAGMPNTNNKIEGTFTGLKNSLRNHCGMNKENRKRFICGFFLALIEDISMKKQDRR